MIKLGFYGAAGEVTGSCYLVTTDKARVMVDMGMHQGEREADEHNRRMPPVDVSSKDGLSAIVLTHAHLDHCGRLPMLVKQGYRGRIHCTPATAELTDIILNDSAHLQEDDAERFNERLRRPGEPEEKPLYDQEDVKGTLPLLSAEHYREPKTIAEGIDVEFFDAGHILGSASVRMTIRDGSRTVRIVFSGDVGVTGSPILRDPVTPDGTISSDVVLLESTYGDRDHKSLESTRAEFLAILQQAQAVGAKVLIPAFAVGRTQDLVYHMGDFLRSGALKHLNVYVDSPMAVEVSDLYRRYTNLYDEHARDILAENQSPLKFPGLTYTRTVEESKRLNDAKGCMVIISASGMCTGGRIVHHLYHSLPNPDTHVVIAGYQGQGTLGRRLVEGARMVRIFREEVPVNAKVHTLGGFSAHAGQSGLVLWAAPFKDGKPRLFLTHGENGPRTVLKGKLKQAYDLDAQMPGYGDVVDL
ncbi:MAG TPA: MBL fold metallo-hydrolase [Phycisphaerales bacterium]|nr:MBL fold metallo-hydrolase [Phycisphaerales bacterium]